MRKGMIMKLSSMRILWFFLYLFLLFDEKMIQSGTDDDVNSNTLTISEREWDFTAWDSGGLLPQNSEKVQNWGKCFVPGLWFEATNFPQQWKENLGSDWFNKIDYAWYRVKFYVPDSFKKWDSVINFGGVRWSAEVWLNKKHIGKHLGGFAPFTLETDGAIDFGRENEILIKVGGFKEMPLDDKGRPEIPIGDLFIDGNKSGGIIEPISLHFYHKVRIQRLLILPDLKKKGIKVSLYVNVPDYFKENLLVDFSIVDNETNQIIRHFTLPPISYERKHLTDLMFFIPYSNFVEWTPENPRLNLLKVHICSSDPKRILEDRTESIFGMRDVTIKEGKFYLNGKRIRLLGANLAQEISYLSGRDLIFNFNKAKFYLINSARNMNINVFKTHSLPMNQHWLDICDRNGMLIISEFPTATSDNSWENQKFLENSLKEYGALLPSLWNHPCIIAYSIADEIEKVSTESKKDQSDIKQKLVLPFIKFQDTSRPILNAGNASIEINDIHSFQGVTEGTLSGFEKEISDFEKEPKDKLLSISEYLGSFSNKKKLEDQNEIFERFFRKDEINPDNCLQIYSQIAQDETLILRAKPYQLILPYRFADWVQLNKWCFDPQPQIPLRSFYTQTYFALRNSLSPITLDIKIPSPQFRCSESLEVQLLLINDTPSTFTFIGNVFLTAQNPFFSPRTAHIVPRVNEPSIFKEKVSPFESRQLQCFIETPQISGEFFLCGLMQDQKGDFVLCQKSLYVFPEFKSPPLKDKKCYIEIVGKDEKNIKLKSHLENSLKKLGAVLSDKNDADNIIYLPGTSINYPKSEIKKIKKLLNKKKSVILMNTEELFKGLESKIQISQLKFPVETILSDEGLISKFFKMSSNWMRFTNEDGVAGFELNNVPEDYKILCWGYSDSKLKKSILAVSKKIGKGTLIASTINLNAGNHNNADYLNPAIEMILSSIIVSDTK